MGTKVRHEPYSWLKRLVWVKVDMEETSDIVGVERLHHATIVGGVLTYATFTLYRKKTTPYLRSAGLGLSHSTDT